MANSEPISVSQALWREPNVPLSPRDPSPNDESSSAYSAIPLTYYWFLLRRYRWRIVTLVLVVTAAVTLLAFSLPKQYESSALLRIDPAGLRVLGESELRNNGSQNDAHFLVGTEAHVITSPAVVLATIQAQHLAQQPEFAKVVNRPGLSDIQRSDRLLRAVSSRIGVTQPIDTFLVQIGFRSHDPVQASNVANALAEEFINHEYVTRAKALTDSSKYMADQVDSLRSQMEQDEIALVDYESKNDVVDPSDKSNIYQARLGQISSELTQAQALEIGLEAENAASETGNLDALLASPRGQSLVPLHDRLVNDQRELNRLATVYGPLHPLYRQSELLVAHDQQALESAQSHVAAQIHDRYLVAARQAQLVSASLAQEKASMDAFNLRAVKYNALKAAAESSTQLFYGLQKQIEDAAVAAGQRSEDLRVISPARPSDRPVSPQVTLWAAMAFVLSSLVGIGAAIMVGILDKNVSNPDQVEQWFRLQALAALPAADLRSEPAALMPLAPASDETKALRATSGKRGGFQEAILSLHGALRFAGGEQLTILALTSSLPGEGKSTVAANLAAASARLGMRTVLVDADLRKPRVHRLFQVSNAVGLSSVLGGDSSLEKALIQATPELLLLPAGPARRNPGELLQRNLESVLAQLRQHGGLIVVDCPPTLGFADAGNIARLADGTLLVVHAGATDRQNVAAAVRSLVSSGGTLLGVVLNRVSTEIGSYYGYYGEYGKYYEEESEVSDVRA